MKYDIIEKYIKYNRPGTALNAQGIVIHETATPDATAMNSFNDFNSANRNASAHYFIDNEIVLNTIPVNEMAWHAGPTANKMFIGIECCHFDNSPEKFNKIYERAVYIAAYNLLNLGITRVTIKM